MTKGQVYSKLTRLFENLTTDDIIKHLCDCYSINTLVELVEHTEGEIGRETSNHLDDEY